MRSGARIGAFLLTAVLLAVPLRQPHSVLPETAFLQTLPQDTCYLDQPLSPYDDLLRHSADSIGWDWRLMAAVVYHESRFHPSAQSGKGAVGLMQVRSARYTEEELLNPRINLFVGSSYLKKLEKMFQADAASPVEALKFSLAAYNLGEGRVGALIVKAREQGLDTSRWDSVAVLLPQGHHTLSYVEKVLNTYSMYARQYPR